MRHPAGRAVSTTMLSPGSGFGGPDRVTGASLPSLPCSTVDPSALKRR